jgi:hypothetical protein
MLHFNAISIANMTSQQYQGKAGHSTSFTATIDEHQNALKEPSGSEGMK